MVGADTDPSLTAEEAGQLAMVQTVLVGAGAGATAALLFAVASGTVLSLLLALLAPLPILIVALGWSSAAGIVASISAAAMLGASLGFPTSLGFLLGVGAPTTALRPIWSGIRLDAWCFGPRSLAPSWSSSR